MQAPLRKEIKKKLAGRGLSANIPAGFCLAYLQRTGLPRTSGTTLSSVRSSQRGRTEVRGSPERISAGTRRALCTRAGVQARRPGRTVWHLLLWCLLPWSAHACSAAEQSHARPTGDAAGRCEAVGSDGCACRLRVRAAYNKFLLPAECRCVLPAALPGPGPGLANVVQAWCLRAASRACLCTRWWSRRRTSKEQVRRSAGAPFLPAIRSAAPAAAGPPATLLEPPPAQGACAASSTLYCLIHGLVRPAARP